MDMTTGNFWTGKTEAITETLKTLGATVQTITPEIAPGEAEVLKALQGDD